MLLSLETLLTNACLLFQAVKYLQLMVVQARRHQRIQNENEPNNFQEQTKNISIDPKTWVKLGHFHLLLEEYRKGRFVAIVISKDLVKRLQ